MPELHLGARLRSRRQELGLSQVAVAKQAGISPSYLNLIEHNRRRIGGALLRRLAAALELDLQTLTGIQESRLAAELADALVDPLFTESRAVAERAVENAVANPDLVRAFLVLYHAFRDAKSQLMEIGERINQNAYINEVNHQVLTLITSIRSFAEILRDYHDLSEAQRREFLGATVAESRRLTRISTEAFSRLERSPMRSPFPSPDGEVADFIDDRGNYFPELEALAGRLRRRIGKSSGTGTGELGAYLPRGTPGDPERPGAGRARLPLPAR